ncbi:MAG: class I SAM-dependent methyltransferase [Bdellovibrionales bacterium]|nr:class I SAM-dependent methyltransferase [Bdellovibrionales bacterium]NQZ17849.1 class I SAM-dependent methyltransferase [Bdellovibrionales bacterium]
MVDYSNPPYKTALQAKFDAQKIAFAPIVFQASKALCDLGILNFIRDAGDEGATTHQISNELKLSEYGVRVLLEVALSSELVKQEDERYILLKTAYFLIEDELTKVNMNFVNDVCYQGMFSLQDAIKTGEPSGLKVFDNWPTIYDGLSQLPTDVQKSWFEFDHYYSDNAFPELLPMIFKSGPESILDVGGNTGKWTMECLKYNDSVEMTIVDLPGQLNVAKKNIKETGLDGRFTPYEADILKEETVLPKGRDVIWMSQFLDCFSKEQIVSILKKAKEAMDENTKLYILETYWDRQKYPAAAFSLHNISLYFTCLANGCSKMYHSDEMKECIQKAGLQVVEQIDNIGISHTLIEVKK